jgi:hypothetical protein
VVIALVVLPKLILTANFKFLLNVFKELALVLKSSNLQLYFHSLIKLRALGFFALSRELLLVFALTFVV